MSIEIANESGVDVDEADLAALARHVLDGMRMHPLAELSVLLVDRQHLHACGGTLVRGQTAAAPCTGVATGATDLASVAVGSIHMTCQP